MKHCPVCGSKAYVQNTNTVYIDEDETVEDHVIRYHYCSNNTYHRFTTIEIDKEEYDRLREIERKYNRDCNLLKWFKNALRSMNKTRTPIVISKELEEFLEERR